MTFFSVVVAWVFFRAASFHDAQMMLLAMTDIHQIVFPVQGSYMKYVGFLQPYGISFSTWYINEPLDRILWKLGGLAVLLSLPNPSRLMNWFSPNWKWFFFILALLMTALYQMNSYTEFLYFQF